MKPQLPLWEELPRDKREHGVMVKLHLSLGEPTRILKMDSLRNLTKHMEEASRSKTEHLKRLKIRN